MDRGAWRASPWDHEESEMTVTKQQQYTSFNSKTRYNNFKMLD